MKYLFSVLIIALCLVASSKEQSKKDKIQEVVEKYAEKNLLNGSIIVTHKDSIIYKGSFGLANIETKDAITQSTLFPIASLTKQFTSTAILILQEDERLSINDKISKYVEVPQSMGNVLIENLMNHTSGIPDYWQNNIANNKDSIFNFLNIKDTLLFSSNTNHSYCNSGYFLLGQIIERVSGMSYDDFLEENIFKPLGMNHTFVYDGKYHNRAIGYDENWNKNDYLITTGDGGIISTVNDLYLWDKALLENRILNAESQQTMFEPLKLENGEIINYGLGWDINESNDNIVSHTGWLASFGTYNQFDKETGYFIILLSNQIRPELMDLIHDINNELYKK